IKNEFPQFGGNHEVVHHSQLIEELLRAGRIRPTKPLDATLAFHDSCYLGRYNGITEAPRNVARAVPGLRVVELPRNRARGLCCGGGGGHMWMEVKAKRRVNLIRGEEALGVDGILNVVDRGLVLKYWRGSPESLERVAGAARLVAAWVPRRLKTRIFAPRGSR